MDPPDLGEHEVERSVRRLQGVLPTVVFIALSVTDIEDEGFKPFLKSLNVLKGKVSGIFAQNYINVVVVITCPYRFKPRRSTAFTDFSAVLGGILNYSPPVEWIVDKYLDLEACEESLPNGDVIECKTDLFDTIKGLHKQGQRMVDELFPEQPSGNTDITFLNNSDVQNDETHDEYYVYSEVTLRIWAYLRGHRISKRDVSEYQFRNHDS